MNFTKVDPRTLDKGTRRKILEHGPAHMLYVLMEAGGVVYDPYVLGELDRDYATQDYGYKPMRATDRYLGIGYLLGLGAIVLEKHESTS